MEELIRGKALSADLAGHCSSPVARCRRLGEEGRVDAGVELELPPARGRGEPEDLGGCPLRVDAGVELELSPAQGRWEP
jgi:hypothetical protein